MLFGLSISEYAHEHCAGKYSDSAIGTASRIVGAVSELTRQQGVSVPDEATFKAYHEQHPKEKNVTKPVEELLSRYFAYLAEAEQKGERDNVAEDNVIESEVIENEPPVETPARGKTGRKPIDGVKRSEKVSLYLTPATAEGIKVLSHIRGMSITDCIVNLIDTYISMNKDAIDSFFTVQSKLKAFGNE